MARQENSCWRCGAAWTLSTERPGDASDRWQEEGGHLDEERDDRQAMTAHP